jgi:hypothetical protein
LNTRPRKSLGWKCPAELFLHEDSFDFQAYWKSIFNCNDPAVSAQVTSGQIIGMKLTQSSCSTAWDQAVLKAIEKTSTLPRDENEKKSRSRFLLYSAPGIDRPKM